MADPAPLLSVAPAEDGLWSVNERGPSRVAVALFPGKWPAMRHALRLAKAKRRCRIAILERDGAVRLSHDYWQKPQRRCHAADRRCGMLPVPCERRQSVSDRRLAPQR